MKKICLVVLTGLFCFLMSGCFPSSVSIPDVPSNLSASAVSSVRIDLTWQDNSLNEKGFYVYRKNNASYSNIANLKPNTISYSDTSYHLEPDTTYWYKVTSYNDGRESSPSNEASATTLAEVELMDWHIKGEEYLDWLEYPRWRTDIEGHVRNNTGPPFSQDFDIGIKGNFFNYNDKFEGQASKTIYKVVPGENREFTFYYVGARIKRAEIWVDWYDKHIW